MMISLVSLLFAYAAHAGPALSQLSSAETVSSLESGGALWSDGAKLKPALPVAGDIAAKPLPTPTALPRKTEVVVAAPKPAPAPAGRKHTGFTTGFMAVESLAIGTMGFHPVFGPILGGLLFGLLLAPAILLGGFAFIVEGTTGYGRGW
jgi:hypothetical protein